MTTKANETAVASTATPPILGAGARPAVRGLLRVLGDYTPRCRLYWTPEDLGGVPERVWVEAALRASLQRRRRAVR